MYKRKIEDILQKWFDTSGHKPIVIKGCRQCGKTYSVVDFAKKHYKNVIYIDFHEHKAYKSFFNGDLDVNTIATNIMLGIPGTKFVSKETCLIFDEIQDCPFARSSLKFFKLDGRYDVICTGSLLGVSGYKTMEEQSEEAEASIPVGYEYVVNMYPMDFEEWLWANDVQPVHFELLKKYLAEETPVPEAVHKRMRELLLQYVIVGGMPEAVKAFLTTHNISEVIDVQHGILETYKSDMVKYAHASDKVRVRECFDSIPAQLSRENKKFTYSLVRKGGRSKEYVGCLQWIEDAGIIRRCYNLNTAELPLDGNCDRDSFKVYMADTGLFVSMLEEGTQWSVMQGNLMSYKGAIFENLVADILGKMGRKLYYYHPSDSLELDFVLRYKNECTPLECKATTGNAKSLKTVLNHPEKYNIHNALKLGDYNIGRNGGILTLPMYMCFLLTDV